MFDLMHRPVMPIHRPVMPIHRPVMPIHRPVMPIHRPVMPMHRPAMLIHRPVMPIHRPAMLMQPCFTSHWFGGTKAMPAVVTERSRSAASRREVRAMPT
ncbi:hypothetical protein IQ277_09410 [Nostocales cyanobacterium LEGE 12452]|nr:hypothetical protein [Nostocales cyanobacterium LEGE 12452]